MATADEDYGVSSYRLDSGRWVTVAECYISTSTLGYLAISPDIIRRVRRMVGELPGRVESQFGGSIPRSIKPLPDENYLPGFTFMVYLVSDLVNTGISRSP